jgi:hypothetical protein
MEVSDQLHALAALPPTNSTWHHLNRKIYGPQNLSGRRGEDKNSASTGTQTPTLRRLDSSHSL